MEIREHRSMFQETVLRNIPFAEEYVFIANRKYESIIRGQLKTFQNLNTSFIFEDESSKTALPVTLALLGCRDNEEILIVSTDAVLEGDYNSTILALKEVVYRDKVGIVGMETQEERRGYNYIGVTDGKVTSIGGADGEENYWDCGIIAGRARAILDAMDEQWVAHCRLRMGKFSGVITREMIFGSYPTALGGVLRPERVEFVKASFFFYRIIDLKTYNDYKGKTTETDNAICENCKNVSVINTQVKKAVVLNGLKNVMVVNTPDALYVSDQEDVEEIKEIVRRNHAQNPDAFDDANTTYYSWGRRTVLYKSYEYQIAKTVVYPDMEIPAHRHTQHAENIAVARGKARIGIDNTFEICSANRSVYCEAGKVVRVENIDETELILIEMRLGKGFMGEDIVPAEDAIVKLSPYLKECIWGGTRLRKLGKKLNGRRNIGESWELSTHPDGESTIAEGKYAGKTLSRYIDIIGKDKLGWKAQAFNRFPLLIKFIDAHESLSIQVHPDDEYAFPNENEYGKNEMWYIVSATKDAFIYAGFNREVTREEVERRVADKTIEQILRKIPVQAGQTYFLRAGTVHAIGKGCLVCEIQQSSNITYRLYDYDKVGKDGCKRPLHVKKALDVLRYQSSMGDIVRREQRFFYYRNGLKEVLGKCKYFSAVRYEAMQLLTLNADYSSFVALVVLEGRGKLTVGKEKGGMRFKKGDTFFGIAKEYTFRSFGKISVIAVTL
jgi:mannose-6-phosphate isomerase class I/mannose-6-phosphate isomerase-like protein (cupin superfamily)